MLLNWWPGCGRAKPRHATVKPGKVKVTIEKPPAPSPGKKAPKLGTLKDLIEMELIVQATAPKKDGKKKPGFKKPKRRPIKRRAPQSLRGTSWRCNWHVASVASLTLNQARHLLSVDSNEDGEKGYWSNWHNYKPETFTTTIDYPLAVAVKLEIQPFTTRFPKHLGGGRPRVDIHPGVFLWVVAQQYKKIYDEAEASKKGMEKYGIWGHQIEDLYFEGIDFDKKGHARLLIGS